MLEHETLGKPSPTLNRIELVLFDLAGTTVDDRAAGSSLVVRALVDAFAAAGVVVSEEVCQAHRGKEKLAAIRSILRELAGESESAGRTAFIYDRFVDALQPALDAMREIDGASTTFRFLRERGIRIGVGSGFPPAVVAYILERMGWQREGLAQYVGSAEQVGASRPDPAMILDAMRQFRISDPAVVLKVG
ncbi:MAG TPA: HAD family hydrolase, partial [Longimicrobiales bacterium]|nr:HAD family hydrolase [Longimicrobiales bacterium]